MATARGRSKSRRSDWMHCPTGLDYSNSEQKRRKPVEIKQAKQPLAFCSVFFDGDIPWIVFPWAEL